MSTVEGNYKHTRTNTHTHTHTHTHAKGGGTYFHLGGWGAKTKKGTNDAHADNITVLMKHLCRDKVSFYMLSVFFLAGGTE